MVSCGEASGDLYAEGLVDALRTLDPRVDVFGFGGPRLQATGADMVGSYAGVSVTGLVEAAAVLRRAWDMLRRLREAAATRRPDVFVAIDFPDFNLRLLPAVHSLSIPIVYYVSPQLWAWRPGRIETIRRYVSKMAVIFPFERGVYERAGVPVEFVGHPLVDRAVATRSRQSWLPQLGLSPDRPLVALLPGSRPNEVRRILPVLAGSVREIVRARPDVQFLVARAPNLDDELFASLRDVHGQPALAIVEGAADDVLAAADVVVTASGTATVQTALHGRPMVIVYGLSPLTYAIGRQFVRVPSYGMPNLIAGRQVVPELIQQEFTPANVARETLALLTDAPRVERMRADLAEVRRALGTPGASLRVARTVLDVAARAHTEPVQTTPRIGR
jgi:lipid-A-disaccharide synthase